MQAQMQRLSVSVTEVSLCLCFLKDLAKAKYLLTSGRFVTGVRIMITAITATTTAAAGVEPLIKDLIRDNLSSKTTFSETFLFIMFMLMFFFFLL